MIDLIKIFSGNSNVDLAQEICETLGLIRGAAKVDTFSDGEISIEIKENVRGKRVFVIQSTCPPVNMHLMELLLMIDALKRASASEITAVIPYYGYGRQDRKVAPRAPISAKLVADLLSTVGATRILCVDLHAGQIQGFFNIPVDNLYARPVLLDYLSTTFVSDNLVIVSPDAGGVERARAYAKRLSASLAVIDKRRDEPNVSKVMHIVGDVKGKDVILLDDIIDTAGTIVSSAEALANEGVRSVSACCTHPVLSGEAIENLEKSPLEKIVVTNTIPLNERARACDKFVVLSIGKLLSEATRRIFYNESISRLFV